MNKEIIEQYKRNHNWKNNPNYKHWMNRKKIYLVYWWIKNRCGNLKFKQYKDYWWRWIKCEWETFEDFYKDMGKTYQEWLQLDRIDNDWNYCKSNCRWVNTYIQRRNSTNIILYKWKCLKDWCNELWLNYNTVYTRINRAWKNIQEALELNF